tara:strand:+ start:1072 stop:1779 length:708 start_codon:yes stop_codon:yes gene_type:complete
MTQQDLFQTAISSQPDIPASHLVRPGSEEARKMTAISGRKYFPLFKQSGQLGAFSRMFLDTLAWASTRCYLTWKPKATPAGRLLFQLAPSMPRTDETESGLWRTPLAADGTHNHCLAPSVLEGRTTMTLTNQVKGGQAGFWATPRTTDGTGGPNKLDEKGRRISQTNPDLVFGAKLADQVKMWPTPTAQDAKNNGGESQHERNTKPLNAEVGGSLNPQWVEWLMGYPEGWTDLKD